MTMIRTLLCTILLSVASQAAAGTLYRWTEPDGSLTFSPEPPPAGIAYDTIETGDGNLASQSGNEANQNLAQTTATATTQAAAPLVNEPEIRFSAVPQSVPGSITDQPIEHAQALAYAPNAANALPQGITEASEQAANVAPAVAKNQNGVVVSSQKFNQCQELSKRVVSLERRLRSKLTPVEVDDTVVAIARYQSNFDRHCE